MPSVWPIAIKHEPPQHSASPVQASPACVQNDGALLHRPSLQKPEQHSPFVPQVLPEVLHAAFSGAQVPPVQMPEQHSPSLPHDWLSLVHWLPEHLKSTHENEQQSGPVEHWSPDISHWPAMREH